MASAGFKFQEGKHFRTDIALRIDADGTKAIVDADTQYPGCRVVPIRTSIVTLPHDQLLYWIPTQEVPTVTMRTEQSEETAPIEITATVHTLKVKESPKAEWSAWDGDEEAILGEQPDSIAGTSAAPQFTADFNTQIAAIAASWAAQQQQASDRAFMDAMRQAMAATKTEGFVLDDEPLTPEQDAAKKRDDIYNSDEARIERLRRGTFRLRQPVVAESRAS